MSKSGSNRPSPHCLENGANLVTYEHSNRGRELDASGTECEFFEILPRPASPSTQPSNAVGFFTIPRARLPLSYLNPLQSPVILQNTRFFTSHIVLLENGAQTTAQQENEHATRVLIAKLDGEQSLFVIEKVEREVYSICPLAPWIALRDLEKHSTSSTSPLPFPTQSPDEAGLHRGEWWASSTVPVKDRAQQFKRRKLNHDEPFSMPAMQLVSTSVPVQITTDVDTTSCQPIDEINDLGVSRPPDYTSQEPLANLLAQYLDALYASNTSLAYFAKGPLSRLRADFGASENPQELSNLLSSLVLSVSLVDKKYRATIPELIKSRESPPKRKRKKKFKAKPNKDGLFPNEKESVLLWWQSIDQSGVASESTETKSIEAFLTSRLSRLRFRETFLQLILILEKNALEISSTGMRASDVPISEGEKKRGSKGDKSNPPNKAKRGKELPESIDILIDRLTIWQSVGSEGEGNNEIKDQDAEDNKPKEATNGSDQLKAFCFEVVIPFYEGRLPDIVRGLTKKLGLPGTLPPRISNAITSKMSRKVPPGTELPRQIPRRPDSIADDNEGKPAAVKFSLGGRKPLSRSHSINHPVNRRDSLSRSNSISYRKDDRGPLSRSSSSIQANQSLKQREVDFSAIGKFYEAKIKKKVDVEQELKDAILNLKKPNRSLAGKELMDAARERAELQKPLRVKRRKYHAGVEVSATPKRTDRGLGTVQNMCDASPQGSKQQSLQQSEVCATGSVRRPQAVEERLGAVISSTPLEKGVRNPVYETPSRGNEKTPWRLQAVQDSSERPRADSAVQFYTPKKDSSWLLKKGMKDDCSPQPSGRVESYERSKLGRNAAAGDGDAERSPGNKQDEKETEAGKNAEMTSIYETLGWDDDFDELTKI